MEPSYAAEALFGTRDFGRFVQGGIGELNKAMAEAVKRQPLISDEDLKKSREFAENIAKLTDQTAALAHKIGEITIPWISDLDKAIEKGKSFYEMMSAGNVMLGEKLKNLPKSVDELTEALGVGKATSSAIEWLKELFGIKPAGAAEARPGQGRPESSDALRGPGLIRFREEIREGTKGGIIEGPRQVLQGPATGAGMAGALGAELGLAAMVAALDR